MKPKPKLGESRAGKRAPGQTATTISLSEETLAKIRYLAAQDGRTVSNWLRRLIERSMAAEEAEARLTPAETNRISETPPDVANLRGLNNAVLVKPRN
jgi:predicted DNA-binding protein